MAATSVVQSASESPATGAEPPEATPAATLPESEAPAATQILEVEESAAAPAPLQPDEKPPPTQAPTLDERPLPTFDAAAPAAAFCDAGCGCTDDAVPIDPESWLLGLDDGTRPTEEEWRGRLTDVQFRVLRMKGTEEIHTGELNEHFEEGAYACSGCSQARRPFEKANERPDPPCTEQSFSTRNLAPQKGRRCSLTPHVTAPSLAAAVRLHPQVPVRPRVARFL